MTFQTGQKIRAIKDARKPIAQLPNNLEIAYKAGDVFIVNRESIEDTSGMTTMIWHPLMGEIAVDSSNFELVSENLD